MPRKIESKPKRIEWKRVNKKRLIREIKNKLRKIEWKRANDNGACTCLLHSLGLAVSTAIICRVSHRLQKDPLVKAMLKADAAKKKAKAAYRNEMAAKRKNKFTKKAASANPNHRLTKEKIGSASKTKKNSAKSKANAGKKKAIAASKKNRASKNKRRAAENSQVCR